MRLYSQSTFLNMSLFIRSAKRASFERPHVIKNALSFRIVHLFAFEVLSGLAFAYIVDGLVFYTPGRALRSSNANILNTPSGEHLNSNGSKIYKETDRETASDFRIYFLHWSGLSVCCDLFICHHRQIWITLQYNLYSMFHCFCTLSAVMHFVILIMVFIIIINYSAYWNINYDTTVF